MINLSVNHAGDCGPALQGAVDAAVSRGVTVVAAAGNTGGAATAPATCRDVIGVGAVAADGRLAGYSARGRDVDVLAPGGHVSGREVLSTGNAGVRGPGHPTIARASGTSAAAPHVAATVAMLLQKTPGLTPAEAEQRLVSTAAPIAAGSDHERVVSPVAALAAVARPTGGAIGALHARIARSTGPPTGPERCTLSRGGCHQPFIRGEIYWNPATGARWVHGGIGAAWKREGATDGQQGYPRSAEKPNGIGGAYQLFEGGKILWGPSTGAHALTGAIGARYHGLDDEHGRLGYPVTGELFPIGDSSNGVAQIFQRGRIYWSPATGAHPVGGAIGARWLSLAAQDGRLGYPTSGEHTSGSRTVQLFQGGAVFYTPGDGARVLHR